MNTLNVYCCSHCASFAFISLLYLDLYVLVDDALISHAKEISVCIDPHLN